MGSNITDLWQTQQPRQKTGEGTPLFKRAMKRTVYEVAGREREWIVEGDTKLSDTRDEYRVNLPAGATKYQCDCYRHAHGEIRARKMCSHVYAVVLARKGKREFDGTVGEVESKVQPSEVQSSELPPALSTEVGSEENSASADGDDMSADVGENDSSGPTQTSTDTDTRSHVASSSPTPTVGVGGMGNGGRQVVALPDVPPSPRDSIFGRISLPSRFAEFREPQWQAIREIVEHFRSGVKVVFLDAPTGSGKTLIGEVVGRIMVGDRHAARVYACTTKALQQQILRDFEDYAHVAKGRANYRPHLGHGVTCEDCNGTPAKGQESCDWCPTLDGCPYRVAKREASNSYLPVLNVAYYLNETKALASSFVNRPIVVIDESDTMEDQLMMYYEVVITKRFRNKLGIDTVPKKTVRESWHTWLAEDVLPAIVKEQEMLMSQASLFGEELDKSRWRKELSKKKAAIKLIVDQGAEGWVLTGYHKNKALDDQNIVFKPIRITDFAREVLWDTGGQFLMMSASTISADQEAAELGLDDGEWAYVEMASSFPEERRPILYDPVTKMSYKTRNQDYPKMADAIERIIDDNPGCRILVHTVSYALGEYLMKNLSTNRTITYKHSGDRQWALERFEKSTDGVLLAPSFERGVDLPGELCEVIVIPKVPWPSTGDEQVSARLRSKGGQTWYAKKTIRSMVQMTGRGMRSADDWCDTYILDGHFARLYQSNRNLFPNWWKEAVAMTTTRPSDRKLRAAAEERRAERGR